MQNKKRLFIGVTGGIGSGKSLVCEYFKKLGCKILHADKIAKDIYKTNSELKRKLKKEFGYVIFNKRNEIDLNALRQVIFSDKKTQHRINEIVHPYVIRETTKEANHSKEKIVIKEAALIFESGSDAHLDFTILVYADKKTRMQRVMNRDGVTAKLVLNIMKLQMPENEKMKRADFIIKTNSTKEDLYIKIQFLYNLFIGMIDN